MCEVPLAWATRCLAVESTVPHRVTEHKQDRADFCNCGWQKNFLPHIRAVGREKGGREGEREEKKREERRKKREERREEREFNLLDQRLGSYRMKIRRHGG